MQRSNTKLRRILHLVSLMAVGMLTASCLLVSERPEFYRCSSSADCLDGERCDLSGGSKGTCYPINYCTYDQACGAGEACLNERCTKVQCTDATASAVCQMYACSDQYTCRTSCTTITDCGSYNGQGYHCAAGVCVVNECDYHDECISGYLCSGGVCRSPCSTSAECVAPATCANGFCF